ncbi:MAG TPA: NnrU family protein [Hyphomonas sp.]|nr:NnrU family protein [Hyphomonas sp.]|tara:strand:- start:171 stop:755 length:585 start_codon:yes stop_codon:yes gene_type:complete
MPYLIAGLVVFFGVHLFSAFRSRKPGEDLKQRIGYGPYMGLYSLISLIGLVLIIYGYDAARWMGSLYFAPSWGSHVNMALMLPALIFLVAANLPTGRIKKALKHPMLVAVKLWALGHLLANGEWNSIILFGSFLAYAVIDRIAVKKRGDNGPPGDVAVSNMGDIGALVIGTGVYVAFVFHLHQWLIGVPVVPGV